VSLLFAGRGRGSGDSSNLHLLVSLRVSFPAMMERLPGIATVWRVLGVVGAPVLGVSGARGGREEINSPSSISGASAPSVCSSMLFGPPSACDPMKYRAPPRKWGRPQHTITVCADHIFDSGSFGQACAKGAEAPDDDASRKLGSAQYAHDDRREILTLPQTGGAERYLGRYCIKRRRSLAPGYPLCRLIWTN
jgi:hypothetical protein